MSEPMVRVYDGSPPLKVTDPIEGRRLLFEFPVRCLHENVHVATINYRVFIRDWYGHRTVDCATEQEAWAAIGSRSFGGLYEVTSPAGLDTSQFVPF